MDAGFYLWIDEGYENKNDLDEKISNHKNQDSNKLEIKNKHLTWIFII